MSTQIIGNNNNNNNNQVSSGQKKAKTVKLKKSAGFKG
jgi:hypothetical protein